MSLPVIEFCLNQSSFLHLKNGIVSVKSLIDQYGIISISKGRYQNGDYVLLDKPIQTGSKLSPALDCYAVRLGDKPEDWNGEIRRYNISWFPKNSFLEETFQFHLSSASSCPIVNINGKPVGLVNEIEWAFTVPVNCVGK